jgi:bifunctional non-homologous end joining protein LigD
MDQAGFLKLAEDDNWVMSQKLDGVRALVEYEKGKLKAWGRDGQPLSINMNTVENHLRNVIPKGRFVFDGELLKNEVIYNVTYRYFVFDLVEAAGIVSPSDPFGERLAALEHVSQLCKWDMSPSIAQLLYFKTTDEKLRLIRRLYLNRAEGVMARRADSGYEFGRRSPKLVKFKFVKDADCVVLERNRDGKENVVLGVYDNGELKEIGVCSALTGHGEFCQPGQVVTVNYLYLGPHGRLVQATNPRVRLDKAPTDCDLDQMVSTNKEIV